MFDLLIHLRQFPFAIFAPFAVNLDSRPKPFLIRAHPRSPVPALPWIRGKLILLSSASPRLRGEFAPSSFASLAPLAMNCRNLHGGTGFQAF
jgi:hypothetical protein